MKFEYNPTLDRLLLVARYAQAGKTKKLENALQGIVTSDTGKDIRALNRLQTSAMKSKKEIARRPRGMRLKDGYVISVGLQSDDESVGIIGAWSDTKLADMADQWWPSNGELHFQLWTSNDENLRKMGMASRPMDETHLSERDVKKLVDALPLWEDNAVDNSTRLKKLAFQTLIDEYEEMVDEEDMY